MVNMTIPVLENIGKQLARNTASWHNGEETRPNRKMKYPALFLTAAKIAHLLEIGLLMCKVPRMAVDLHISSSSTIR